MNKVLILNKIKEYKNIKSDADFARFLGIKPQTLSSWYARNTFDVYLLYSKCVDIDANWLLTGDGQMLKPSSVITQNGNNNVNNGHNISGNKNKIESSVTGVDVELLEIIRKKDEQIDRLLSLLDKK